MANNLGVSWSLLFSKCSVSNVSFKQTVASQQNEQMPYLTCMGEKELNDFEWTTYEMNILTKTHFNEKLI